MAGGHGGHAPNFVEIIGFSEILIFRRQIYGLLLLVKIEISPFIGKSLNMLCLLYRCHDASAAVPNFFIVQQKRCVLTFKRGFSWNLRE